MADEERIKLLLDMGVSKENVQAVVDQLDKLEDGAKKSAAATDKLAKGGRDSAQSVLELSRAFQDFTSGGLLGISNNIEGIARALGAGAAGAGVATGLFLAVQTITPALKRMWSAFVEGSNDVPQARDGIDGMTGALAEANKQLDALKGKQALTNKELAEFNRLTAGAAKAQKELTEAKKREAEFQGLREQKGPQEEEDAQFFGELIGPDIDALRKDAASGLTAMGQRGGTLGQLNADLQEAARQQAGNQARDPMDLSGVAGKLAEEVDRLQKRVQAERERLAKEADRMVQAAAEGKAGGIDALIGILPGRSQFRGPLSEITPEARRRQDEEVEGFEEEGRKAHEAGEARRKAHEASVKGQRSGAKAMEEQKRRDAAAAHQAAQRRADALQAGRREQEARRREQEKHRGAREEAFGRAFDRAGRANVARMRQEMEVEKALFGRPLPTEPGEHLPRKPRVRPEAREAQQGIRAGLGALGSNQAVAKAVKESQARLEAAQNEGLAAIMGALAYNRQTEAKWRMVAREARQMQQPATNGGWG